MSNAIKLLENQKNSNNLLLNKNTISKTTVRNSTKDYKLKKRIIEVLDSIDIYENKKSDTCIPDSKFPKIRWDEDIKAENPDSMTDEEIKCKFQLLTKESKHKKRKICNNCYKTGKRGIAFDIPYFYKGNEDWDSEIPVKGKSAELGCKGCAWYDFAEWRKQLLNVL